MKFSRVVQKVEFVMSMTAVLTSIGYSADAYAEFINTNKLRELCLAGGGDYYEKSHGAFGCKYSDGTHIFCDVFGRYCFVAKDDKAKLAPKPTGKPSKVRAFDFLKERQFKHEENVINNYTPISKKKKKIRFKKVF